jgi:hypothetical protein
VSSLLELFGAFAGRVNGQASLRTTLADWTPQFFIEARDTGDTFQVCIEDGRIDRVVPTRTEPSDEALLLRAPTDVLEKIFGGALSPLGAYTDGQLEVYGHPKDQIKLDVIALVVWGA